jgi:hypothetical protein
MGVDTSTESSGRVQQTLEGVEEGNDANEQEPLGQRGFWKRNDCHERVKIR